MSGSKILLQKAELYLLTQFLSLCSLHVPVRVWKEDREKFKVFFFVQFLTKFLITRSRSNE